MINFFKLLNFEWNRFAKLYSVLFVLVFVLQSIGLTLLLTGYITNIQLEVKKNHMSNQAFIEMYGEFGLDFLAHSLWFAAPIAISVAALLFYVPFIWYRDWFARNTFIYRLLMLPTARMNLFFAKLTTIMISVLGMVAYQLVLLLFYKNIIKWMIPSTFRSDAGVIDMVLESSYLSFVIPAGVMEFFVAYGLGLAAVIVIFTVILMERSFRWIGLLLGIVYIPIIVFIFLAPILTVELFPNILTLYPSELFLVELSLWIVIIVGSLLISNYLIHRKVTV